MMDTRVFVVASSGIASPSGRNFAAWASVNSGLSSSGVSAKGAASTAAQSIWGAGSEGFSFKFLLFTGVGLSERNHMHVIWCRLAKHHYHPATCQRVVTHKAALWVDPAHIFMTNMLASNIGAAASKGSCRSRTLVSFLAGLQVKCIASIIYIQICIVNLLLLPCKTVLNLPYPCKKQGHGCGSPNGVVMSRNTCNSDSGFFYARAPDINCSYHASGSKGGSGN